MEPLTFADGAELRRTFHRRLLADEAEARGAGVHSGHKQGEVAMLARVAGRNRRVAPLRIGALGLKHAPIQGARNVVR